MLLGHQRASQPPAVTAGPGSLQFSQQSSSIPRVSAQQWGYLEGGDGGLLGG